MAVGFLPDDLYLQYNMVSLRLMILFSWDMTLCEEVNRSRHSEVMYCPHLQGSPGMSQTGLQMCVICRFCYVHLLLIVLDLYMQKQTSELRLPDP